MKNPRFKQKAQETYLKYALRINIDHMASLLYVLHELYPKNFTKANIQKYINCMIYCAEYPITAK